ncbi:MAG: type II toxin-antitoxin system RelE/ParE family toxin [Chloroflexi bacterium]|nr:type II toxin-antitoxin system RelE/ParE family toxin [Chloroflexota bacterium]MBI3741103.1 type II toxin-antitoxin system RelE/ParE family toxin [Chloroflexota bacterium]
MASYKVDFKPSVHKDYRRLPKSVVERAMKRIEKLKDDPFPHGVEKLEDADRLYRLRVGDYRIVYEVDTQVQQIIVLYVRHRREVYRAL